MEQANHFPLLKDRRAHEICGTAALSFALAMAAYKSGHVLLVDSSQSPEHLHPFGVSSFIDPSRLIIAYGKTHKDILWITEEALRTGCVPVVITRIAKPIDLTAGRRLQLAAEAGQALALCLIPEGFGSNAAETRWRCTPAPSTLPNSDSTLFHWDCIKNKTGTTERWTVRWNETAHHIDLLSETPDGPLLAAQTR
ncbi:ImuA family protein [Roseibium sp.]|uniref:ImuA family protein n=1 Tax=Roseibium sp. TaxID=1936156 RepID=UPI003A96D5FF